MKKKDIKELVICSAVGLAIGLALGIGLAFQNTKIADVQKRLVTIDVLGMEFDYYCEVPEEAN